MIGIVLAAGGGTRLRPLTDDRPKTLLEVDGRRTILDQVVANLAASGVDHVVVVTGYRAEVIARERDRLAHDHGVRVELRDNPRHAELNNAYSLWLVRDLFASGCLLVNGDTVHPATVEATLLDVADDADVTLALDGVKSLGEEEMKVVADDDGTVRRISKQLDPRRARGEYIGVARIHPSAGAGLGPALQEVFERDGALYYEDGFQQFLDAGGRVRATPIGDVPWVEVDDHDDLARARALPHPL